MSGTTISTSGTVINLQQSGNNIQYQTVALGAWTTISSWPATITSSSAVSGTPLIVTLTTDLTISTSTTGTNSNSGSNVYFIIGNAYTTFAGNNKSVSINSVTNYPGLIRNGTQSNNGFANITIENLGVLVNTTGSVSTLANNSGWICQSYFGKGVLNNSVNNCYSTGAISSYSGGIFGTSTGDTSGNVSANNCYSTGIISGYYSGGIFGTDAGYNSGTVSAMNCYSTGIIRGDYSGGIFGAFAGDFSGNVVANNCYSTGIISGNSSGGIFGAFAGNTNGTVTANNCYFNGTTSPTNQLYGSLSGTLSISSYYYGYAGSWSDTTASTILTGVPTIKPGIGTTWTSITANTPFSLTVMQQVIIASISPYTGPNNTTPTATINAGTYNSGSNTTDLSQTSLITVNGTSSTFNIVSSTSVTVSIPTSGSTGYVPIVVTTPLGLSQPFYYIYTGPTPTVSFIPTYYYVSPKSIIIQQPQSQTIDLNKTSVLELSVVAENNELFKYQWYKNTIPYTPNDILIPNSNSPILIIDPLTKEDEGDYYVVITNSLGGLTISDIAVITIV